MRMTAPRIMATAMTKVPGDAVVVGVPDEGSGQRTVETRTKRTNRRVQTTTRTIAGAGTTTRKVVVGAVADVDDRKPMTIPAVNRAESRTAMSQTLMTTTRETAGVAR